MCATLMIRFCVCDRFIVYLRYYENSPQTVLKEWFSAFPFLKGSRIALFAIACLTRSGMNGVSIRVGYFIRFD